jgi:hypothetical protein
MGLGPHIKVNPGVVVGGHTCSGNASFHCSAASIASVATSAIMLALTAVVATLPVAWP